MPVHQTKTTAPGVGLSASVLETIGNTPLVALDRLTQGLDGRVFAKLEYMNPGSSKKDRVAIRMIEEAERLGHLTPGQTVVELTSGNTGTGLAIVCAVKGYPFVAVMSRGNSTERATMMQSLGAEVILVEQQAGATSGEVTGHDLELVEVEAQRVATERAAFRADQFNLEGNTLAQYDMGREVLAQAGGQFQAFCDFVGTGGGFAGCAAAFKEYDKSIRCFVVEPVGAAALSGQAVVEPNHPIQGGGYLKTELPLIDREYIDGFLEVSSDDAIATCRRLAQKEGLFAGFSSGANVSSALSLLRSEVRGGTVFVTLPDSGMKYLSTDLWGTR